MGRAGILAALILAGAGRTTLAQKRGLAFWEPSPASVDRALALNPKKETERYAFLRDSFVNYECAGPRMNTQAVGKHGRKNLVCTLPGTTSETIIVVARYDDRGKAYPTWADALMLPLLYHALRAQPRQDTFVFAGLDGDEGERVFFHQWHEPSQPQPAVVFVLDRLGLGNPRLVLKLPKHSRNTGGARTGSEASRLAIMRDAGTKTAELMNIPDPSGVRVVSYNDSMGLNEQYDRVTESTLAQENWESLEAILYSEIHTSSGTWAFHEDFDFLAWYLCEIDAALKPGEDAAAH
ncbi:MAG: hypothetical protein WA294_22475 [Acidobacteriaceae bacterium]